MFRKLFLVLLLAVNVAGVGYVSAQTDVTKPNDVTPEQAISRLTELVDFYSISLNSTQREEILGTCRQLQAGTLQDVRTQLVETNTRYNDSLKSIDQSLRFTANALREMSEDSSSMDLASFNLSRLKNKFDASSQLYIDSLDQVLIIDCQVYPEQFVAGVEDARARQSVAIKSATDIKLYLNVELANAFGNVKDRLIAVEGIAQ